MDRDTQGKQVKPYAKKHMSVQHQLNNIDCGVFAFAFATECAFNIKTRHCNLQKGCNANSSEEMFNTKQI